MRITFTCKTNKDYCAINVAKFLLPTGSTITVDRTRTEWDIDRDNLTMTWYGCYLWAIDDNNIFTDEAYITDGAMFEDLVADARILLLVDEDVDEDYEVDVLDWKIGE
jgi:hypothetical protein